MGKETGQLPESRLHFPYRSMPVSVYSMTNYPAWDFTLQPPPNRSLFQMDPIKLLSNERCLMTPLGTVQSFNKLRKSTEPPLFQSVIVYLCTDSSEQTLKNWPIGEWLAFSAGGAEKKKEEKKKRERDRQRREERNSTVRQDDNLEWNTWRWDLEWPHTRSPGSCLSAITSAIPYI